MAVTLTDFDLTQPEGELSNAFFPAGDLDAQLEGWLAVAIAKVEADSSIAAGSQNDAAAAWVYYHAYDYIANQIRAMPASVSEGKGVIDVSWQISQSRDWADKAASKLAIFLALQLTTPNTNLFFTVAQGQRGR